MKSVNRLLSAVIWIAALFSAAVVPCSAQSINGACLYALDSTAQQAFFISGNAKITTNCSIVVESVGSAAFTMGGTDTLYLSNHAQVGVVGGWQLNGQSMIDTISGQQVQPTTISNSDDPLASVPEPTQGTIVSSAPVTYSQSNPPVNNTLSPGVYCGGLSIGNSNGAQYTMSPGTYIMAGGGFSATSAAILVGTGVTIYNTSSIGWGCSTSYSYTPITINGQAKVTLSAPTTGALAGIVIFGDRVGCATPGSCQDNINGKATATFNGILYLKSDQLLLNGSSSTGGCMDAVADKITINGDTYSGGNGCFLNSIAISVSPTAASLYAAQTQQFIAAVTNTYFTDVTWSVSPAGVGTIDQTGLYTAPSNITTQQSVVITATSQADTTKTASATITLYPAMAIGISPTTGTLYSGQQASFTATVTNAQNTAVTWSSSPSGVGSVSSSGVYTAPSNITTQQTVTVTATSQANTALAASATVTLMPSVSVTVSPATTTLASGQSQQFTATVMNAANTAVSWSISPGGVGTISASGVYTAPATISASQTVTVTAISQADSTKSASATVTLIPVTSVSISPATSTLYAGQQQQFTATVSGASNTGVTWSISPSFVGSINGSGLYTAPATISSQQVVTVTAASTADPTKAASALVVLIPACASSGYGYVRSVQIGKSQVVNSDQSNFRVLIALTDTLLKSASNGGHVASDSGYDIMFAQDAEGVAKLDFEIEKYDPAAGVLLAWVRLPNLSHTQDVQFYVLYGNAAVTTPQQNPQGVWGDGFFGVWHFVDGVTLSGMDSSQEANTAIVYNAAATSGQIDGGASFNGANSFVTTTTAMSGPPTYSISLWFKTATKTGGKLVGFGGYQTGSSGSYDRHIYMTNDGRLIFGNWTGSASTVTSSLSYNDGNWHMAVATLSAAGQILYVDGKQVGANSNTIASSYTGYWRIGFDSLSAWPNQPTSSFFLGSIDEVRVYATALSADQVADEYVNQKSPNIFSSVGSEQSVAVSPAIANLYAGQSIQLAGIVSGICSSSVTWSMPAGSPGTLSSSGLYTAPSDISVQQSVAITATSQTDPTKTGRSSVVLLPKQLNVSLTLSAVATSPYVTGSAQQFVAALTDSSGLPVVGQTVYLTISGANNASYSAMTDGNGIASFSYTGNQSGSDTLQAAADFSGTAANSNTVVASWLSPAQAISMTTIVGQFFVTNGSGAFNVSRGTTPLFTQVFPTINFNPPGGTVPGNTSGVGINSRPFTDVTTDFNGNFTGTIVAAGNGYQAGVGTMGAFQAVFTGQFIVASPGNVVFNIFSDDGFILGIGNGATRVSGADVNRPAVTPFALYPTMGAIDSGNSASGNQVVVNFPAAGTYPFELDYTECCGGPLSLTLTQGATSSTGIAPTGSLTLSPSTVAAQPIGGQQALTVLAKDAAGNPVANAHVGLVITQADNQEMSATTDATGHATFVYQDQYSGTVQYQAVAFIDGMLTYSNTVLVSWAQPSPTSTTGGSGTLSISVNAKRSVTLPNTLQLSGSVSDSALATGDTIKSQWSQVSGPGTATFTTPNQPVTSVSFDKAGDYVLALSASDLDASGSLQVPIAVYPAAGVTQGWLGSPAYGATVSGVVPITVSSGETLQSGVLTYYPASDPGAVTVLNPNTTGSGQIGVLDTTQLNNGSYYITLQATDTNGNSQYNLLLVTVTGNYKPGRVTATVTDLIVPVKGLPIQIQRMYDSLNANTVGDFGYGWNLGTNVNLTVGPKGDVAFTLGGVRRTFYLTPQGGGFFPFYFAAYTGEPGFHGTLSESAPGCSDLLDILIPDGSLWVCPGGDLYNPPGYVYTDPTGTSYTMTATGTLQSIVDKNGNAVTITASGIRSSTGLSVPFVRDGSGRITQITDPQGHVYQYGYDDNGNLASVTYPDTPTSSTYTYDSHHLYLSGTDFRSNPLPSSEYYGESDTDAAGHSLNGRLKSVTDALGETTSYAYDLATYTTTVTYPADGNGSQGVATMVYNSLGDLLSSTDPLNHTTTNVYDASRNLTSVTDPMGRKTTYTYDSNGNKTSTTYPATSSSTNTTSSTAYNQYSEPTSTTDELGNARTFNYDDYYNPQSVADTLGTLVSFQFNTDGTMQNGAIGYDIAAQASMASHFAYDSNGNLSSRTDALGRVTSYTYDSMGRKVTMTVPVPSGSTAAAATTSYSYDDFGNLTQTSAPLGRTTASTYDSNGNKLTDTDANGHVTHYVYDALNRLQQTTYPDGTTSSRTYDFRGNVLTETDQGGHVTKHVYDLAGRETSVTRAFGTSDASTTTYEYDDAGRKVSETDSLGHATSYSYDAAGNLTGVSGVGGTFTYGYDNARNRVSMADGNNNTTTYKYDARKRLTETDYPDGTNTKYGYDGPGNLLKVIDQAGHEVDYSYDAANQLQQVTQASSPNSAKTTVVGYDANGNPITVQDANTHTTATSFDLLGEVTGKTLPDGSLSETRTYDTAGNLLTLRHFNGVTTTYTYDNLNRLLSRTTPGEAEVGFTYTATGKRQTMSDASGTTTYSYDDMDRLSSKATPEGTLNYTYDTAGHVASITSNHANGVSVSYTYDDLNRLETVVDARLSGSQTTTYGYDPASNVGTVRYPNGVQSTFSYDTLNRVTGLSASTGSYAYQRGAVGNLISASESSGRGITWSYDGINRLTSESISGGTVNGSVSYSLDPVGNRGSASSSLTGVSSGSWNFNADDELTSESYDANGNVIATGGNTFSYNSQNQLVSMNGGTVQIVYDGDGNRVAKTANGATTRYLVDDLNPTGYAQVVEELSGGVVQRQYTYGLQRISQQQAISNTWTRSFFGYDGGGSVRQLTNAAGAVTDTYDYDAFGNVLNKSGSTPNAMLYRGEQFDPDLGLYYLRARYYNPLTGRFMSRDPNEGTLIIPATLHKYFYTGGDPVNRVDPRGRALEDDLALDVRSLTQSEAYAARELGVTRKILGIAIHGVKAAANLEGNPDIWISISGNTIGNVYLQVLEEEQIEYELLDNLFAYFP